MRMIFKKGFVVRESARAGIVSLAVLILVALAGCSATDQVAWLPAEYREHTAYKGDFFWEKGVLNRSDVYVRSGDTAVSISWEREASLEAVLGSDNKDWPEALDTRLTAEQVSNYAQAVSAWMEEQRPETKTFQIGYMAVGKEAYRSRETQRTLDSETVDLLYSVSEQKAVNWDEARRGDDILGNGEICWLDSQQNPVYIRIRIVE